MKLTKTITLLTLFIICSITVLGQRELNYIYLFDCTKSMEGYGGVQNIWQSTKNFLQEDIARLHPNATVNIVPFQDKNHEVIKFTAEDFNWRKVESKLDEYIANVTHTNICSAWDEGIRLIDQNKDNYFFLLTDGIDNVNGINELIKRIKNWCAIKGNNFAFYVMLTKLAQNPEIEQAISGCENIVIIDQPGDHPKPIVKLNNNKIVVNYDDLEKTHTFGISILGKYNVSVANTDPRFNLELESNYIVDGSCKFKISTKSNADQNRSQGEYKFKANINSPELTIANPDIDVTVIYTAERLLDLISEDEVNIGKAKHYPEFLFVKKKPQTMLEVDLAPVFNDESRSAGSQATFRITESNAANDFIVFFNGQEVNKRTFEIDQVNEEAKLGIRFNDNATEGKRYFRINVENFSNLNRINNAGPKDYELSLRARYDIVMNPLLKGLIWLSIIIFIALLAFAVLSRLSNGKIKYNIVLLDPVSKALLRKNEARKLILTNNPKLKQGFFNYILFGKSKYVFDDFWQDTFELSAANRGVRISHSKVYDCDPYTNILKPDDETSGTYTLMYIETKDTITIHIR